MCQRFVTAQWVPYAVDPAFTFFANARAAEDADRQARRGLCTAESDDCQLAACPAGYCGGSGNTDGDQFPPGELCAHARELRGANYGVVWYSHFCDEQVRGPFEFFRHRHGIQPEIRQGRVGTQLTDEVEFSLPLGSVGYLWDKAVQRRMKEMLRIRQEGLPAILEAMVRQTS